MDEFVWVSKIAQESVICSELATNGLSARFNQRKLLTSQPFRSKLLKSF